MVFCSKCGAETPEGHKFCEKCGANLRTGENSNVMMAQNKNQETSRTIELVLGIMGTVFGLIGAVLAILLSTFGGSEIFVLGMSALIASIVGLVGSIYVKSNVKYGGIILIISAVWLLISISAFGIIGAIFLGIAGILALIRK